VGEATTRRWVDGPLEGAVEQSLRRLCSTEDVVHVAVMPDVHLAEAVCNGVALATRSTLLPHAVGGDIGCGMAAVAFDGRASALRDQRRAARVLQALKTRVPINRHGKATAPGQLPEALEAALLSDERLATLKRRDARVQLGTLGRGNHFLELQADQEDRLWLMLHSGSRAAGLRIFTHHVGHADDGGGGLPRLQADSAAGQAYLADHDWAVRYAQHSRQAMVERAAEVVDDVLGLSVDWDTLVQCEHNVVRREEHGGGALWVHRKGAIAAHADVAGIIPGSMGAPSYHVTGRGCEAALCSSSHGAGRAMCRSEARRRIGRRELERQLRGVLYDRRRLGRLVEEAPSAYKAIDRVMRAQRELTRIERRLRPLLSYKGV